MHTECRNSDLALNSINILLATEMCCRYGPVRLCLFSLFGTSHQSRHPVSIFLVKSCTITEQKNWDEYLTLPMFKSRNVECRWTKYRILWNFSLGLDKGGYCSLNSLLLVLFYFFFVTEEILYSITAVSDQWS